MRVSERQRLFGTEGVRDDLRRRSVRSGAVTVGARAAQMALQLGSVMILGRLLTPADFGIQAMVIPVAILVNSVANLGLQTAVIHREELDAETANAMFALALRVNVAVTLAMACSAPLLAWLYNEPRVVGVVLLWSIAIFGSTLSAVQEALLKRQMQFGLVMKAQFVALVLSVAVAIGVALAGGRYWALILQIMVMELVRAAIVWVVCPWRPSRAAVATSGGDTLAELRTYWSRLSSTRIVAWLGDQLDRVTVGAIGGAAILGLYDSAKRWAWFPFLELFISLSDVAIASLSRVRHEPERYREYVRNVFMPILAFSIPTIAFIYVEAGRVLHVLLGDQWLDASSFLRLLCIAAIASTVSRLMQWIYLSMGETARQLRWTFISTPITAAAVLLGARGGAYGVAVGFTLATCTLAIPNAFNALSGSPVTALDCLRIFARPLISSGAAAALLLLAEPYLPMRESVTVALILGGLMFFGMYALVWMALPGGSRDIRAMISGLRDLRRVRDDGAALSVVDAPDAART